MIKFELILNINRLHMKAIFLCKIVKKVDYAIPKNQESWYDVVKIFRVRRLCRKGF